MWMIVGAGALALGAVALLSRPNIAMSAKKVVSGLNGAAQAAAAFAATLEGLLLIRAAYAGNTRASAGQKFGQRSQYVREDD